MIRLNRPYHRCGRVQGIRKRTLIDWEEQKYNRCAIIADNPSRVAGRRIHDKYLNNDVIMITAYWAS